MLPLSGMKKSLEPYRGGRLLVRMSVVGAICTAGLWYRGISVISLLSG